MNWLCRQVEIATELNVNVKALELKEAFHKKQKITITISKREKSHLFSLRFDKCNEINQPR